ncbi:MULTISPECIES: DNA-directed RNA polymerase subunit beta [unclassified Psychrobacillus]|uniref:DNA-directed RNA polymerase subunit beta n=1 Tax=unclassified Psychrobacillus TaxID=2636677 RepID=UPI00146E245D|nr:MULTISPECIES: DNA-directed RNA polymerase subunit beta [unclassified Psychrobacillus]MCM3356459.1 DNA-directed RNA polymerase subunit beta [Psychrobacillus sp. MER TA 171]NME05754.1 DNA-directed RNA polymerase subunit beta [Psychrobacillus sp. BL-248-WT-3]
MTEEVKSSSRQQRRLEKTQGQANKKEPVNESTEQTKQTKWVQIRMFPIWLRILIVAALIAVAVAAGLMVGYGVIGEGEPKDALKWETYQHIFDIKDGK